MCRKTSSELFSCRGPVNSAGGLPDTSGYSKKYNFVPWKSMLYSKQLRVARGSRSEAIMHAINWVYSSGLFPECTDIYAAGAWVVLAHGLVCTHDGLPTSNWIYEEPKDWKVSKSEVEERVNRAFLLFPGATDVVVSTKQVYWQSGNPTTSPDNTCLSSVDTVGEVIGQWASTRKVLSLAGVTGLIEEDDVFEGAPQQLRFKGNSKQFFCVEPTCCHKFMDMFAWPILLVIRYWPKVDEIHTVLNELRGLRANPAGYHAVAEFLTGKPRVTWKLESFKVKADAIVAATSDPFLKEEPHEEWLNGFSEEFKKKFIVSLNSGEMKEFSFLSGPTPSATYDSIAAIEEEVNILRRWASADYRT